jgi:hypothetical protein
MRKTNRGGWGKNGHFSVKSQYKLLCETETEVRNKIIWKAKILLKIKVFMWLVKLNAILTRDNLARRDGRGIKPAASVLSRSQLNTCSLAALFPDMCGV